MKIYYQNVRGVRTKLQELSSSVNTCEYDVILFTETSLYSDIHDNELGIFNFNIYRTDRSIATSNHERLGGTMIAVRKSLCSMAIESKYKNIESTFVQVISEKDRILFGCVYLPPRSPLSLYENYMGSVEDIMDNRDFSSVYLCGDFNLPNITWQNDSLGSSPLGCANDRVECIANGFAYFNLYQVNSVPNCNGGFLDLIFTDRRDTIVSIADDPLLGCDNYHPALVFCILSDTAFTSLEYDYSFYDYRKANYMLINEYLGSFDWNMLLQVNDVNESVRVLYEIISRCIKSFVPECKCKSPKFPKWYSPDLKNHILQKKMAHKNFRRTGSQFYYNAFSELRHKCKNLVKSDYQVHIEEVQKSMRNRRQFWRYVNDKRKNFDLPNTMKYGEISSDNPQTIADFFAEHFKQAYTSEAVDVIDVNCTKCVSINDCTISVMDVLEYIEKIDRRLGCGPDEISPLFVFNCRFILSPVLHNIFETSLKTGVFPEKWKCSYVNPIFKSGDRANIENYRAISKMPIFAKIFDAIVTSKIGPSINKVLINEQHGFVPGRSTTTNLLNFEEYILEALEGRYQVDVIYTDLSKAFDRVNHSVLISRMHSIGVYGSMLMWLQDYLSGRTQIVKVNNNRSSEIEVTSGVPQGSHLSPLLFNCFINGITGCFSECRVLLYADDLKLFRKVSNVIDCMCIQEDLARVVDWCHSSGLRLNIEKCKIMRFFRNRQPIMFNYVINDNYLENLQLVKDLGIFFDPTLSFKQHFDFIVNKSFKLLGFMKRSLTDFNNIDCFKSVYCSVIRSVLEFGSNVWSPYYKCHKNCIERVQRRFLRFVAWKLNIRSDNIDYDQISKLLAIPTLENRRICLDVVFLFKLITGLVDSPELLQRVSFHAPLRNTRSQNLLFIEFHETNYASNKPLQRMCRCVNKYCDIDVFSASLNGVKNHMRRKFL